MQRPALIFEYSPLFLFVCALLGLAYAYLLYKKSGPWGANLNKLLFAFRFLLASIIAALLVSPILKQIQNTIEAPTYVIAVDNSASIASSTDSLKRQALQDQIAQIATQQKDQGFEVEVRTISGERFEEMPASLSFDYTKSDLSSFLEDISIDFEGRNLGGVMLVSDGIYNEGVSPTFRNYNYELNTVGIGDTVPKSDVSIKTLVYNKISYQGNKFPLIVQFAQKGFDGKKVNVSVIKNGTTIASESTSLKRGGQLNEIRFLIEAENRGFQRYTVRIQPLEGEHTTLNNVKQAYIEVIEGKENIAIIAAAPHPDIKALRFAVESNANYSFDQYILSLPADRARLSQNKKKYDLIIYHQLPDRRGFARQLSGLDDIPALRIYGGATDIRRFNQENDVLTIDAVPGEFDNVNASFNQAFVNFKLSEDLQQTFQELPPITVPFGRMSLNKGSQVMLYQQVGSIVTNKPLVALNEEVTPKKAVILGDGLWKWNLTSYVINDSHEPFNELISKLVQFLSSKEDKRKFKAYPIKNEFTTNEPVIFDTEVYNDLYERVYGNKIDLSLKPVNGQASNYTFITNENNTRYTISGLDDGVYRYTATTVLGEQRTSVSGEFLVKDLQVEDINLTADFGLLRQLAEKTNGSFYTSDNLEQAKTDLNTVEAQGVIHSSEKYLPFINLKWMFFLLLLLVSAEWFIRKYSGSY